MARAWFCELERIFFPLVDQIKVNDFGNWNTALDDNEVEIPQYVKERKATKDQLSYADAVRSKIWEDNWVRRNSVMEEDDTEF